MRQSARNPAPDPGSCSTLVSGGTHVGHPGHGSLPFPLDAALSLPEAPLKAPDQLTTTLFETARLSGPGRVATLSRPVTPDAQHHNKGAWADRAWRLYVALGGLATIVYLLAGASAGKRAYFTLATLSSVVAILTGIRLHRPRRRLPWYLFAAGIAMFVLGDFFYYT